MASGETRRRFVRALSVAAAYAASGWLGLQLAVPPGYATAIFPAAGVALAALLLYGVSCAPGVWLGSFAMNLAVAYQGSGQVSATAAALAAGIGVGSTLQALAGAQLIRRTIGFPNLLDREKDVGLFLLFGGPLSCLVSATVGVSSLVFYRAITPDQYLHNWLNWWVGDVIGVLVATPLVLAVLGRPLAGWRPRRAALLLPPVALLAASIALFLLVSQWEQERLRAQFHQRADIVADRLQAGFDRCVQVLRAVERFYASSTTEVERREFRRFVQPALQEFTGLAALSWNPLVHDAERTSFEAAIRREGYADFRITERDARGQLQPAARRGEYVVVAFIEPDAGNEAALGYDIASDAPRREAVEHARDSGAATATRRIRLVQEREEQWGALVLQPVFREGGLLDDVESRRRMLRGFAVGVVRMGHIVQVALPDAERRIMSVRLLDASAPRDEQTLYESGASIATVAAQALRFERAFQAVGRSYRLVALPTADHLAAHRAWTAWAVLAASLLFCGLLQAFLLLVTGRTARIALLVEERTSELSRSRERLALALEDSKRLSGDLERRVAERTAELQERQRATEALGEMTELLQAAEGVDDVPEILARLLGRLLAGHSGAVYLAKASLNYLERISVFGAGGECPQTIAPVECWALKRGHTYGAADASRDVFCAHAAPASAPAGYVCVPMHARGAPVGLLHVRFAAGAALTADAAAALRRHLQHIAEQIAVGLANLRLRETLREQSIRDALTGLFNRRYLEEALERDLARAGREAQPLAVFMLDVDHFKRFNDVHGHEAGDAVLRTLATALQQACRTGDLACRFGGEEFTVLLYGSGEETAAQWAQRLIQRMRGLEPKHNGRPVGGITISLGLAVFPDHGNDVETLLQAADLALYEAKRAGRDRMMVFRPSAAPDEVAARNGAASP